jgi:hypothetical protein
VSDVSVSKRKNGKWEVRWRDYAIPNLAPNRLATRHGPRATAGDHLPRSRTIKRQRRAGGQVPTGDR